MKLSLNGQEYRVPREYEEKLLADLLAEGTKDYHTKLEKKWQVIAMVPARLILKAIEDHAAQQNPEAAQIIRPAKGEDPVLKLGWVFSQMLLEGLKHVNLAIDTTEGTITAFNLAIEQGAGEAGRLVDFDGSAGQRQDNRTQIS